MDLINNIFKICLQVVFLFAGSYPLLVQACAEDKYPGQYAGNYLAEYSADQPVLIAINNLGADLFIEIEAPNLGRLNSPGGRNSNDYLFLETLAQEQATELCLYSSFRFSAPPDYRIREFPLDHPDSETLDELRSINQAAVSWEKGGFQDVEDAGKIYSTLVDSDLATLIENPGFAFDMIYYSALTNFKQRRYSAAEEQLLKLQQAPFSEFDSAYRATLQLGKLKVRQGEFEAGEALLEQVRNFLLGSVATNPALAFDIADADTMLGEVYATAMQIELAEARLVEARQYARPDFQLLGHVNNNQGYLSVKKSEIEGIDQSLKVEYLQAAVQRTLTASYFYTEAGDIFSQQIAENNAAVDYVRVGERRKSLLHFSNLIAMLQENPNPEGRAFYFANISNYQAILGQYNKARAYIQEAIRLSEGSDSRQIPGYHCRLGTLHRLLGNLDDAFDSHNQCLSLAMEKNWPEHITEAMVQLSVDHSQRNQAGEARRYIESALANVGDLSDPNILKRLYTQYGEVLLAAGEFAAAELAVINSRNTPIDGRYFNDHIDALYLAQRISEARGDYDSAVAQANETLLEIEALYSQLDPEKLSPSWSNQTNKVFQHLSDMYLSRYQATDDRSYLEKALYTIERSRDPALRQHLSVNLSHDVASLINQEKIRLFSEISNNLAMSDSQRSIPTPKMVDYYHQHDLLSLARLNNIERIDVPEPVSLLQVQASLPDNQLVLYYFLDNEKLRLLIIDANTVHLDKFIDASQVSSLALRADQAINLVDDTTQVILTQLSEILLPDLGEYPNAEELLVVGREELLTLPFSALSATSSSYQPLIESYAVKMLPSLSSYFMEKPVAEAQSNNRIAIFADPVFSNLQLGTVDRFSTGLDDVRGWSDTLQPLPFSALEAVNISKRFPGKTDVFTGTRASRENLGTEVARNAKVLHIATHGYFKSAEEDKLGLALASVDEAGNPQSGFITLTELFSYAFNNELVVISGCETALGQAQAGIGLNSLARGFLVQGGKHVISTLWSVSDRASATFMSLFYSYLDQQQDVSIALQLAQKEMSNDSRYSHPFYWAAYTLTTTSPDSSLTL